MSRSILVPLLVLFGMLMGSLPVWAGPAMGRPDPRQMSGIPRPDPQIPAGEITVRVLRGGFDAPALDAVVTLEVRSADGRTADLLTAEAGNQGRAHFRGLEPYAGGQAVARVVLDGQSIRSQQIEVRPDTGTAVMLVKGAPKPKGQDPTLEVSLPGIVFDFDKSDPGTLMVGVFDLEKRQGLEGQEVRLLITTPDGQTETRTQTSGKAGQALFSGLSEVPAGAKLQVESRLDAEGEPHRSQVFENAPDKGRAVVLARGRQGAPPSAGGAPPQGGAQAPTQRAEIPAPRVIRDLAPGTVQIMVVDGFNQPVANHPVTIVKKDFSGTEQRFEVETNGQGIAVKSELPLITDGLYYVGIAYDEAPYTSPFFGLDKRGGVRVGMRVFEVTDDPSVARSAIEWQVIEGENDNAQVIQVYTVVVGGDKAYWPGKGMRIEGLPGAKGMVVLRGAEEWLDHEEKAPYATLSHPIPPGEVVGLSIGYIMEHDGEIEFDWPPPFEVVESVAILPDTLGLDAPGSKVSDKELPPSAGLDFQRVPYDLGQKGAGALRFTVTGLRRTNQVFRQIGIALGSVLALVLVLGVVMRPRGDTRVRLERRKDELLAALETRRTAASRERVLAALDRVYRQLDALEGMSSPSKSPPAKAKG